jgi:Fe-S-cluster-containing dehydrogenase component
MSCPYSVRYLNEEERVVEKCTLCEQLISEGGLPQCVSQCSGRARYFGDIDSQALSEFRGPDMNMGDNDLQPTTLASECEDFSDAHVHALPDVGNKPTFRYILRKMKWRG